MIKGLKNVFCYVLCLIMLSGLTGTASAEMNSAILQNFNTTDIDNNTVELKNVLSTNKVTMINLWTTWCGYCIQEMPYLEAINQQLQEKDCAIIGIMMDGTDNDVIEQGKGILASNGVTYLNLLPPDNAESLIPMPEGYPTSYFVDSEGNILDSIVGAAVDRYEPMIDDLLQLNINAADKILPGSSVQMSITGITDEDFTWSVEGGGAKIDGTTGLLTLPSDATAGSELTVTARSQAGDEINAIFYVNDGVLSGQQFGQRTFYGYTLPHLTGNGWQVYNNRKFYVCDIFETEKENYQALGQLFTLQESDTPGGFAEDPEVARGYLEKSIPEENEQHRNIQSEMIEIEGHPALVYVYDYYDNNVFNAHIGFVIYPRNTVEVYYRLLSIAQDGGTADSTPAITTTDMKTLASRIRYDESKAIFTRANAAITVSAKGDPVSVTAGKSVQFSAVFADTEKINKKNKNDTVTWTVANAENGTEVLGVTISDKGQLKIDKSMDTPVDLVVRAASPIYGTEAEYRLSATPVIKSVVLEPTEVFFYTGVDAKETIKATLDPASVPPKGITWVPAKEGIVEITEVEDGIVTIKPIGNGKTTIAVKEPSGKNAKLNVSIVDPVAGLELSATGKTVPGGTVTIKAALEPKTAGNKNLEWSLNVGEDTATINAKGQVKISKEAVVGTKIIVTCKALGAPEPVVSTIEFEVNEK